MTGPDGPSPGAAHPSALKGCANKCPPVPVQP